MSMFFRYILLLIFPILACSGEKQREKHSETIGTTSGFISLHPAITETIFYIGAQDKLVGRSDYCTNPSHAEKLPNFGTSFTPNLEAIAKEKPLGILADQSIAAQNDSLKQITAVHELAWLTKEDLEQSIAYLGKLLDAEEKSEALVSRIKKELAAPAKHQNDQKVLMVMLGSDINSGQIWYIRKDSLHGTALSAAGFQNAAPDIKATPSMSIEELISINPDIILLMGTADIDEKRTKDVISFMKQFSQIKAARDNRIARVQMHNIHGIGPGILELPQKIIETIESLPKK